MHFYYALLKLLCVDDKSIKKRGIVISIAPGQVEACANSLRSQFGIGQKAMFEVLNKMHNVGLINWHPSKVASLAEMISVLGWYDEKGEYKDNSSLYSSSSSSESVEQEEEMEVEEKEKRSDEDVADSPFIEGHEESATAKVVESSTADSNTDSTIAADLLRQATEQSPKTPAFDFSSLALFNKQR